MAIQININLTDYKKLAKALSTTDELICLDASMHIRALLVAREMLIQGEDVKAKIIRGYK
jgi:hypothetical protein